jgi:hypothetical protein
MDLRQLWRRRFRPPRPGDGARRAAKVRDRLAWIAAEDAKTEELLAELRGGPGKETR